MTLSALSITLISCGEEKKETIVTLDSLHEFYTALSWEIPEDLISACDNQGTLSALLDKSYITPKMHSSIMGVWGPYSNTCQVVADELGGILGYKLNRIVSDKLVYRFVYDLEVGNKSKSTYLVLILNREYGLSEFHIYVNDDGKSRNIFFPQSNSY